MNMVHLPDEKDHVTTTEASHFLNVTRFTVLNWIKQGKIKAAQTIGGHQRISKKVLLSLLTRKTSSPDKNAVRIPRCWESKELAELSQHNCTQCLVFKKKASRCFLTGQTFGSMKIECKTACLDCAYFEKYYPDEKRTLQSLYSQHVDESERSVENEEVKPKAPDGVLHKVTFSLGRSIRTVTRAVSKQRLKILKPNTKDQD